MKIVLKILFPVLVVGVGVAVFYGLVMSTDPVQPQNLVKSAPSVRVQVVKPTQIQLRVHSQGMVKPGTDINIISEVSGTIERVSPALAAGGYFEPGDVLMEIDPIDYELAVVQAGARLLEARARLLREEAEAEIARIEWDELGKDGTASPLLLREPQLAEAKAAVESADASVKLAARDLEKTKIKAPFAGRVLSTSADVGQYIQRGSQLAQIYSIETAEIRLPLSVQDLAYVDIPFSFRGEHASRKFPKVTLSASIGGKDRTWMGRVVRTEGEIDPRTRMITAVAEVENPYGRTPGKDTPPLAAGLFVQAEIEGKLMNDVFELPRTAMNGINRLLIVDREDRLHLRDVKVLKAGRSNVVIQSGLSAGDRVCLTTLETPVENMKVTVASDRVSEGEGGKMVQGGVL